MADPTKFVPGYDYTSWQSSNPTKPLPGNKVDQDFANVATSIDEAVEAIKDVRRSDGALKNGIVTLDSLSPQVAAGVGSGALASAEAAAASADAASDSADAAASSAVAAAASATAASGYASTALTHRNAASGFADDSAAAATLSQTARDFANKWAVEAEGVDVDDGVNPVGKSAYHWAQVALGAATGALPDNSVSTSKIVDANVTTAKLADGAVTSAKIADGTIATADIADGAITSAKIADGAIATGDLADGAVTSAKIADGTIATGDIADGAVTSAKLATPSAWEVIGAPLRTATNVPSVDITDLGDFSRIRVHGKLFVASDNVNVQLRTSTDNGSTFAASSGDYAVQAANVTSTTFTGQNLSGASGTGIFLTFLDGLGNATNEALSFDVQIFDFNQAAYCFFHNEAFFINAAAGFNSVTTKGVRSSATARNALRIIASSGNIASIRYTVEGIRG